MINKSFSLIDGALDLLLDGGIPSGNLCKFMYFSPNDRKEYEGEK